VININIKGDDKVMQEEQKDYLLHENITSQIIGSAFEVINELGSGFLESVYVKAMVLVLNQKGLTALDQYPMDVRFRGVCVGEFFADIIVEDKVIVEIKAIKALKPEHQAQVINYLTATGIEVGLLLNFGNPKLEFKRLTRIKGYNEY
jgi:GxxExxY protein